MHSVILFDGVCNYCIWWVNLLIKLDKKDNFRFLPIQSEKGKELIIPFNLSEEKTESVLLIEDGKIFSKSSALFNIIMKFPFYWRFFVVFKIIPRPVRDWFYDLFAKNRYKIFGRKNVCIVPDKSIVRKFL